MLVSHHGEAEKLIGIRARQSFIPIFLKSTSPMLATADDYPVVLLTNVSSSVGIQVDDCYYNPSEEPISVRCYVDNK